MADDSKFEFRLSGTPESFRVRDPERNEQHRLTALDAYVLDYFKYALELRPEKTPFWEFLAYEVFSLGTRHIDCYVALKDFTLPGRFYLEDNIDLQRTWLEKTSALKNVKFGTHLMARYDESAPSRVDVEILYGHAHTICYRLNSQEWLRTLSNLGKVRYRCS
jgi:hypothetical protein